MNSDMNVSPNEIKQKTLPELYDLCKRIREVLIETIAENGGHLASNLGVVELTVSLHNVFESPKDQIVWDVGHQCYTHKLLTGRAGRFATLRRFNGLSGFPKPLESAHDPFIAGHSSTSISAGLGLAKAKSLLKEDGYTICVIGDGAISGGMAFEALNNAGRSNQKLIVVLNDNEMSISKSVGAISKYLTRLRNQEGYFNFKDVTYRFLNKIPLVGARLYRMSARAKDKIKEVFLEQSIFEKLGFAYLGPVDGHDIKETCKLFNRAKMLNKPVIVHVRTVKGRGYPYAEDDPKRFHGLGKFDVVTGEFSQDPGNNFSDYFGKTLREFAVQDKKICAVSAAMIAATGLRNFCRDRLFDVGIAEQHAVTFAAGMAKNGMLPVVAIYSTFLQRAYDQILHDVCIAGLHVLFAVDRAGLVGEDGETHHGVFDPCFLTSMPDMQLFAPANYKELGDMLKTALYDLKGPVAIRYPRGKELLIPDKITVRKPEYEFCMGGSDLLICTYGKIYEEVARAAEELKQEQINASVLRLKRIKPIASEVYEIAAKYRKVFFIEEAMQYGGIGEHFAGVNGNTQIRAIKDQFVPQGSIPELYRLLGLDSKGIAAFIRAGL